MTTPAPSPRLFLALWPPAAVQAGLQAFAQEWSWPPQARRTAAERLHVTLHFLGAVARTRLPELRDALGVPWNGCELVLDRAQVWPGGIAVLEASEVPPPLAQLHTELGVRLRSLGIAVEERRYRPHVTFARKAVGARPPATPAPLHWDAPPRYELVESLPGGRGYVPLAGFG